MSVEENRGTAGREVRNGKWAHDRRLCEHYLELTDPTPIDTETIKPLLPRLEAAGIYVHTRYGVVYSIYAKSKRGFAPQPETIGDLYCLLLRLEGRVSDGNA